MSDFPYDQQFIVFAQVLLNGDFQEFLKKLNPKDMPDEQLLLLQQYAEERQLLFQIDWSGESDFGEVDSDARIALEQLGVNGFDWDNDCFVESIDPAQLQRGDFPPLLFKAVDEYLQKVSCRIAFLDMGDDAYHFAVLRTEDFEKVNQLSWDAYRVHGVDAFPEPDTSRKVTGTKKESTPVQDDLSSIRRRLKQSEENIFRTIQLIQQGTPNAPKANGNPYMGLAHDLQNIGEYLTVFGDYDKAKGAFHAMATAETWLYRKHRQGIRINPEILSAGSWQELLISLITRDEPLVKDFADNFSYALQQSELKRFHVPESLFIGKCLVALIEKNIDKAKSVLSGKRPALERMFKGTYEILDALVNGDSMEIGNAIKNGGILREKYLKQQKTEQNHAVYLYGAGFVCLVECLWEKKINAEIPLVPSGLIEVGTYEPYPLPEFIFSDDPYPPLPRERNWLVQAVINAFSSKKHI